MLKVCAITGISICALQKHLKKRGLSRSNKVNSRKYQVDHSYFNMIDSEEKAYWLGFLYADGYVTKPRAGGKYIGCAIGQKDENHLTKLRKALGATYPIKTYTTESYGVPVTYCRLLMTSEEMFDALVEKGVLEKKSLILKFPTNEQVSEHLMNHFIRGYFDGDGSFSKSHDGYCVKICGTKEFLEVLGEKIGFPSRKLSKRYKDKKNNYCLEIGGRHQVVTIGNLLYRDATVWMERKRKRYISLHNSRSKIEAYQSPLQTK